MSLNGTQPHPLIYTACAAASEQLSHCHRDTQSLRFGLNLQSLRYIYCQVFYWKHLPTPPIKQRHPVKLSVMMKTFFIYTVQYGSHWPHVATDSQDLRLMGVLTPRDCYPLLEHSAQTQAPRTFCPDSSLEKPGSRPINQHKSLSNFCKTSLGFSIWLVKFQEIHYKAF